MNTAILITARLKSTRLKEKALKPIKGRPMLSHMLDRLRLVDKSERIILCTSTVEQDDRLCLFSENEHIDYFRGDPDDVLLRMCHAAEKFNVGTIISCTADNPLIEPEYIDKLVNFHLEEDNDFSYISGLPIGTFAYVLKYSAVKKASK